MITRNEIMKKAWSENARKYVDCIGSTGRRPVEEEFQATIADLKLKFDLQSSQIETVLDIGCNNGFLMKCLEPNYKIIVGSDFIIEPMLRGKRIFPQMQFIQSDIMNLPFKNDYFDRVLCYNMYHYLPSPEAGIAAARELFRVLKKSGLLMIGDLFTAEHQHLIPKEDFERWNDQLRPYLHRIENWMFMPIEELKKLFLSLKAEVQIVPQNLNVRCPGYRYDIIARKG